MLRRIKDIFKLYILKKKFTFQSLTILNSKLDDQGSYTCTVTDHSGNKQIRKTFVRIQEEDEPSLDIFYEGFQTIDKTISDGTADEKVQWVVTIESHPQATVAW